MSYAVCLPATGTFTAWRLAARRAISHAIAPEAINWQAETAAEGAGAAQAGLFARAPLPETEGPQRLRVGAAFLDLAQSVVWHKAPERFGLLYLALWRLARGEGAALSQADALGRRLGRMRQAVGRDIHKMHAFLRFQEVPATGHRRHFVAWFEPEHFIVEPACGFFCRRFADMDWDILTPQASARFQAGCLSLGPGGPRPDLPSDATQELWGTYFAHIFNPARVKLGTMQSQMPKKYWKNMPETALIPEMLAQAEARVAQMQAAGAAPARPGAAKVTARLRGQRRDGPNTAPKPQGD